MTELWRHRDLPIEEWWLTKKPQRGGYEVRIPDPNKKGARIYVGYFRGKREAQRKRDEALMEHWGKLVIIEDAGCSDSPCPEGLSQPQGPPADGAVEAREL